MLSLLISILPIICIGWYLHTIRKYKDISYEMRLGEICYSCKDIIPVTINDIHNISPDDSRLCMCISCKRDESIQSLLGMSRKSYINRLKKYIVSDKSRNFQKTILIFLCIGIVLDMIILFGTNLKGYNNFVSSFNIIYWTFMILKRKYSTVYIK